MKLNWFLAVIIPAVVQVSFIYGLLVLTFSNESWAEIGTIVLAIPCLFLCIPTNHELARHFVGRPCKAAVCGLVNVILLPTLILGSFWVLGQIIIGLEFYS